MASPSPVEMEAAIRFAGTMREFEASAFQGPAGTFQEETTMKTLALLVTATVIAASTPVHAEWIGGQGGLWPESWPEQLEPLRNQAWTWEHNLAGPTIHEIRFNDRDAFEAAWPHILQVRSSHGAIILLRSPDRKVGKPVTAGVRVLTPGRPITPAEAAGLPVGDQTEIELIVDGTIVDLNRIPLPAKATVIDRRFGD
ncbi:MAG: hypothetical protein ACF8TS_12405 [Maioricimonas sp. JB049]